MKLQKTSLALLLVLPALLSFAGFFHAQAQTTTPTSVSIDPKNVCADKEGAITSKTYYKKPVGKECDVKKFVSYDVNRGDVTAASTKICVSMVLIGTFISVADSCDTSIGEVSKTLNNSLIQASASTTPGKTSTNTPTSTPTTKTPTTSTPTTTKNTTIASQQGDCPSDNFEAKGPLCVPKNPFGSSGIAGTGSIGSLIVQIISILLWLSGIIAVIMLIIGGYQWMTARGNDSQTVTAKKTVTNAVIGLVIVLLAYFVIQLITNVVTKIVKS